MKNYENTFVSGKIKTIKSENVRMEHFFNCASVADLLPSSPSASLERMGEDSVITFSSAESKVLRRNGADSGRVFLRARSVSVVTKKKQNQKENPNMWGGAQVER